jgi:hypothetical protein
MDLDDQSAGRCLCVGVLDATGHWCSARPPGINSGPHLSDLFVARRTTSGGPIGDCRLINVAAGQLVPAEIPTAGKWRKHCVGRATDYKFLIDGYPRNQANVCVGADHDQTYH